MKIMHTRYIAMLTMLVVSIQCIAQSFTLKGKVSDNDGNALEFATVSCVDQAKLTMTNLKASSASSCNRPTPWS